MRVFVAAYRGPMGIPGPGSGRVWGMAYRGPMGIPGPGSGRVWGMAYRGPMGFPGLVREGRDMRVGVPGSVFRARLGVREPFF